MTDGTPRSSWTHARIRRPIFVVLHVAVTAVTYGVFIVGLIMTLGPCPPSSPAPSVGFEVLMGSLIATLMSVRVWLETKRLHDMGWSGWWALVALAVTVGSAFLPSADRSFAWVPASLALGWFLFLALKPGDAGANRFGEAPAGGLALFRSRTAPDT